MEEKNFEKTKKSVKDGCSKEFSELINSKLETLEVWINDARMSAENGNLTVWIGDSADITYLTSDIRNLLKNPYGSCDLGIKSPNMQRDIEDIFEEEFSEAIKGPERIMEDNCDCK